MIQISKVEDNKSLKTFIDLPHILYKNDPNYVPELYVSQEELLNTRKHPFHRHSKVQLFLAFNDGNAVGRIAAIRNNNHNKFNSTSDAFFGFFETVEDYNVAKLLFDAVLEWSKGEGLNNLIGPANFSTNETCGMLINAYDSPPLVMMTYNKPFYNDFVTKYGFSKQTDLLAYSVDPWQLSEKSLRLLKAMEERLQSKGIIVREIDRKKFKQEAEQIKEVYNASWNRNFGFVPMTDDEFEHMTREMKMIYDPRFCFVAEKNGKIIGFSLSIPDINQVLIRIKRGRLLPTGIIKLLYYKKKINHARVITLGVIEEFRKLGIESCFYAKSILYARNKKYTMAEASWILEGNTMMNQALLNLKAIPYKSYRIYEMHI
jgi:hypothetical protein